MSAGSRTFSARWTADAARSKPTMTLATCPSACTPASVRLAPATVGGRVTPSPISGANASSTHLLHRHAVRLPLPADVVGAVVGEGQLQSAHVNL